MVERLMLAKDIAPTLRLSIDDLKLVGDPFKDMVVVEQSPTANQIVAVGTEVDLIVASKPEASLPVGVISDFTPVFIGSVTDKGLTTIDKLAGAVKSESISPIVSVGRVYEDISTEEKKTLETTFGISDKTSYDALQKFTMVMK